ncbi:TIGR00341 family protein [Candidatus Kaiserbacteria bacterium]|nr:TIGR00341 family protein [Candidatus Kaiserbacteria bacterium]
MPIIARFRAIEDKDKASAVRTLIENSTPNFDFFYFVGLSITMATLGLLADSPSIVIGSMLIAPLLYPILALALGFVMSDISVISRSLKTLTTSLGLCLFLSVLATLFFGSGDITNEVLLRTEPTLLHLLVAVIAGAAVAYALAQPEWSATLPGIAISVALIPPLAVVGVGIASFNMAIITGSAVMLLMNFIGIVFAAMVSFSLMDLHAKQNIAQSTIVKVAEKETKENAAIAEVLDNELKKNNNGDNENK